MQQDKDPASNPDWLRKVEQAERSGDFFPKDSVIINGGKIEDRLIQEIEVIRLVYTNEDFQGIRKEPVTPTSTPKPEHPGETIRTQPGSRRIHRPDQTEIAIDQLIKQGNKAPDKSGTILRAIAAAGNIVPHIPVGVGMVGRETVEAGERFYNRSWSQRGEVALMWWEKIALAAPNLNIQSIAKANAEAIIRGYSSYLYNPESFHSFALDGSQQGLSAQLGIGIGKNLTYGAASYVAAAPFAGGGVTSIFPEGVPTPPKYYQVGERLPDGRIAGNGPGAALTDGPDFVREEILPRGYTPSPALEGDPYSPDFVKNRRVERKWWKQEPGYHGAKPKYENPGHHDPTSPHYRGGGSMTTTLPPDAAEVYKTAIPVNEYTWYGRNSQGEFYRYQGNNGAVHWNGRETSSRGLPVPTEIRHRFERRPY